MPVFTEVGYLYRDCANYKVHGEVYFLGCLGSENGLAMEERIVPAGEFIAEQLGFPVLYPQLWRWTKGPSSEDHVWHEFVSLRIVDFSDLKSEAVVLGRVECFYEKLIKIEAWDESLSCHFGLEDESTKAMLRASLSRYLHR